MKRFKQLVFAAVLVFISTGLFAQRSQWKNFRYDLIYGVGATNFLGELGGANKIGTHVIRDLKWKTTREMLSIGMRYRLNEYLAVKGSLAWARLYGNDKFTKEYYRHYRNLNFFSNVFELTSTMEAAILKEQTGKHYRLRGVRGTRGYELYSYFFAGAGVFHFNPRTRDEFGQPISLQPLHTEGQDLLKSRKHYHRTAATFPIGIGFKYTINRFYSIGLEYGVRFTFTDYIDDVSTTYVGGDILSGQADGAKAVKYADRSLGTDPGVDAKGQQRGDPKYNDAYMFAVLTLNVKLKNAKGHAPRF